jgi:hypothetical protein
MVAFPFPFVFLSTATALRLCVWIWSAGQRWPTFRGASCTPAPAGQQAKRKSFPAAAASPGSQSRRRPEQARRSRTDAAGAGTAATTATKAAGAKVKAAKASVTRGPHAGGRRGGSPDTSSPTATPPALEADGARHVTVQLFYRPTRRSGAPGPSQSGCRRRTSLGIPYGWRVPAAPPRHHHTT